MVSKTYVAYVEEQLVGFFSMATDILEIEMVEDEDQYNEYTYGAYPALKIARLAVDQSMERKGIGHALLEAAVTVFNRTYKLVGCRYLTVDAKRDALDFYTKWGFIVIKKYRKRNHPKIYINMKPVIDSLKH